MVVRVCGFSRPIDGPLMLATGASVDRDDRTPNIHANWQQIATAMARRTLDGGVLWTHDFRRCETLP